MIIWPKERFNLREDHFFSERFPAYEKKSVKPKKEILSYVARIFASYVHFFMERESSIAKLYEHFPAFQPVDLFR
jgi:hypothetical protein